MDLITLAMAKKYADGQRLAYVDPAVTLSWDGDLSNAETIVVDNITFVKVSNNFYDLTRAASLTIGTVQAEITSDNSYVESEPGIGSALLSFNGTTIWAISATQDVNGVSKGTWVRKDYTAITFAETIHPIDPKYLPGVCLPVVELSTTVATGATLTDEENAALTAAYDSRLPIAIRCNIQGSSLLFENSVVIAMTTVISGAIGIAWTVAGITVQIAYVDGAWIVYSVS